MKAELNYIGQRIKKIREAKGMTMAELGNRCDVSEQHIGLLERGRSGISVITLIRLAKALNVSTDSIIVKEDEPDTMSYTVKDTIDVLLDGFTNKEMEFIIGFIRLYRESHPTENHN